MALARQSPPRVSTNDPTRSYILDHVGGIPWMMMMMLLQLLLLLFDGSCCRWSVCGCCSCSCFHRWCHSAVVVFLALFLQLLSPLLLLLMSDVAVARCCCSSSPAAVVVAVISHPPPFQLQLLLLLLLLLTMLLLLFAVAQSFQMPLLSLLPPLLVVAATASAAPAAAPYRACCCPLLLLLVLPLLVRVSVLVLSLVVFADAGCSPVAAAEAVIAVGFYSEVSNSIITLSIRFEETRKRDENYKL